MGRGGGASSAGSGGELIVAQESCALRWAEAAVWTRGGVDHGAGEHSCALRRAEEALQIGGALKEGSRGGASLGEPPRQLWGGFAIITALNESVGPDRQTCVGKH